MKVVITKPTKKQKGASSKHKALVSLSAKEWLKGHPMLDLKTTDSQRQFAEKLPILQGGEPFELMLDWMQRANKAIVPATGDLPWQSIQDCLLWLTKLEPRNLIREALEELKGGKIAWPIGEGSVRPTFPFHNLIYKDKNKAFMTKEALNEFKKDNEHHRAILGEVLYRLKELYFGMGCIQRNAFNYNRNVIMGFRCETKKGIRFWHNRLAEMQKALVEHPWKAVEHHSELPKDYTDIELRSLLAMILMSWY